MKHSGKSRKKRSQHDYNLGFKLSIVSQVEKGEMLYLIISKVNGCLPKKNYTKTTNSKHWLTKHPNLIKDNKTTKNQRS